MRNTKPYKNTKKHFEATLQQRDERAAQKALVCGKRTVENFLLCADCSPMFVKCPRQHMIKLRSCPG